MMHSKNSAISIRSLNVTLGNIEILRDISFEIEKGGIFAIIGPNGSGKTTLLKAILGIIPSSGAIRILGKKPEDMFADIGYVPQRFFFDRDFPISVHEFLLFSLLKNKGKERIKEVLREVEMESYEYSPLGILSGGQFQRILIARAVLNEPKILFLDEPTTGVDLEGEKGFYEIIQHLNSEFGVTVIMVSHEINIVYKYADGVICLNKDLICFGEPKTSITDEVLQKLYGENLELRGHSHH